MPATRTNKSEREALLLSQVEELKAENGRLENHLLMGHEEIVALKHQRDHLQDAYGKLHTILHEHVRYLATYTEQLKRSL